MKNNFEVNLGFLDNLFEIKYDFRNFYHTLITGKNSQIRDEYVLNLFKQLETQNNSYDLEIRIIEDNKYFMEQIQEIFLYIEKKEKYPQYLVVYIKEIDKIYKNLGRKDKKILINFLREISNFGRSLDIQLFVSASEITRDDLSTYLLAIFLNKFMFACNSSVESKRLIYRKGLEDLKDDYFYFGPAVESKFYLICI